MAGELFAALFVPLLEGSVAFWLGDGALGLEPGVAYAAGVHTTGPTVPQALAETAHNAPMASAVLIMRKNLLM
jgi:hypothetical protein